MSRTRMIEEYKSYAGLTEKEQEWFLENYKNFNNVIEAMEVAAKSKKEGGACSNVKRVEILKDKVKLLKFPVISMNDTPSMIAFNEEKYLGAAINSSPVDGCDISEANCTCKEFLAGRVGRVVLAVMIQDVREITIKKGNSAGEKMAFLVVSDSSCSLSDVCIFADAYKKHRDVLIQGNTVLIEGEADKKRGGLIIKHCVQI